MDICDTRSEEAGGTVGDDSREEEIGSIGLGKVGQVG